MWIGTDEIFPLDQNTLTIQMSVNSLMTISQRPKYTYDCE